MGFSRVCARHVCFFFITHTLLSASNSATAEHMVLKEQAANESNAILCDSVILVYTGVGGNTSCHIDSGDKMSSSKPQSIVLWPHTILHSAQSAPTIYVHHTRWLLSSFQKRFFVNTALFAVCEACVAEFSHCRQHRCKFITS
jgi:hypothetical protein